MNLGPCVKLGQTIFFDQIVFFGWGEKLPKMSKYIKGA